MDAGLFNEDDEGVSTAAVARKKWRERIINSYDLERTAACIKILPEICPEALSERSKTSLG
jgi:hypothetical protein